MTISALDEGGKPVDWWFIYKVPKLEPKSSDESKPAHGYEYFYYDPRTKRLAPSAEDLVLTPEKPEGALDWTLTTLQSQIEDSSAGYILYNDEMPAGGSKRDNDELGHTKGVIAFDADRGTALWMLHSWPKFWAPNTTKLPTPDYGQTFMCISLDLATVDQIAAQMVTHQQPQVFMSKLPKSLPSSFSGLHNLTGKIDIADAADTSDLKFRSRGKVPFRSIAKNRRWGKDFWNDLVGPTLGVDLAVETWFRGKATDRPSNEDSDGKHEVSDVKTIDMTPLGREWKWSETKDHAKWAVSLESDWVCVGDINRQKSQEKRGGGTIAVQEPGLWKALSTVDGVKTSARSR